MGSIESNPIGPSCVSDRGREVMPALTGFVRIPEHKKQEDAAVEINNLQLQFAAMRELGVWTSPYPQIGYSQILGCQVREVRAKDMVR